MKKLFEVSGTVTYAFTVVLEACSEDDAFDVVDNHPAFNVEGLQLTDLMINNIKKV